MSSNEQTDKIELADGTDSKADQEEIVSKYFVHKENAGQKVDSQTPLTEESIEENKFASCAKENEAVGAIADLGTKENEVVGAVADHCSKENEIVGAIADPCSKENEIVGAIADPCSKENEFVSDIAGPCTKENDIVGDILVPYAKETDNEQDISEIIEVKEESCRTVSEKSTRTREKNVEESKSLFEAKEQNVLTEKEGVEKENRNYGSENLQPFNNVAEASPVAWIDQGVARIVEPEDRTDIVRNLETEVMDEIDQSSAIQGTAEIFQNSETQDTAEIIQNLETQDTTDMIQNLDTEDSEEMTEMFENAETPEEEAPIEYTSDDFGSPDLDEDTDEMGIYLSQNENEESTEKTVLNDAASSEQVLDEVEDQEKGHGKKNRKKDKKNKLRKRFSDRDTENYRNGYPGKEDDPELNDNIKFYMGEIPSSPDGALIDDIHKNWIGDYELLERHHGYIQWLFPIRENGMNWQAQALQLHEAEAIKADRDAKRRFLESYKLILDFYGMKLLDEETGKLERSENWKMCFDNLNWSSHNYLRITRILKCLGELGYEHLKKGFIQFVLEEALVHRTLVRTLTSCRDYWIGTIKDDTDREELYDYIDRHGEGGSW